MPAVPSSRLFRRTLRAQMASRPALVAVSVSASVANSKLPNARVAPSASPSRSLTRPEQASLAPPHRMLKPVSPRPVLLVVSMEVVTTMSRLHPTLLLHHPHPLHRHPHPPRHHPRHHPPTMTPPNNPPSNLPNNNPPTTSPPTRPQLHPQRMPNLLLSRTARMPRR
jgi:hypothetical protein